MILQYSVILWIFSYWYATMIKVNDTGGFYMIKEFNSLLGSRIDYLNFQILPINGEPLKLSSFENIKIEKNKDRWFVTGSNLNMQIVWSFEAVSGGWKVYLSVDHTAPIGLESIIPLQFDYNANLGDSNNNLDNWLVPVSGNHVTDTGFVKVSDLDYISKNAEIDKSNKSFKAKACGVFKDADYKGVFLSAVYPLNNNVNCTVLRLDTKNLRFNAQTEYDSEAKSKFHQSESFWVCTDKTMRDAMEAYASFYKEKQTSVSEIPVGWNSWDYYFRTVSLDDVIENMEAIKKNPDLSQNIKYIVVDDGWSHNWGEWQPNYRFPGGLERLVEEIKNRDFIPGIWTAPLQAEALSYPVMRTPGILIKNQYNDPLPSDAGGHYLIDPTNPDGQIFLRELFTRLYNIGFRLFKVDYVNSLLKVKRFYKEGVGPYEALRELFRIIRSCVKDSHIIGCSLPEECGPNVADSGRVSIDIHNHWSHVEWVIDSILHNYWLHKKIWINDPDFLIVRGQDTSLEIETNVTNPGANNPNPVGFTKRWRYGPVFNEDEARTWTNIVIMSGGSVFLGDRISMLNAKGLSLVKKALNTTGVAARPLDLGDDLRPYFWLQDLKDRYRLLIINWKDISYEFTFDFNRYNLPIPIQLNNEWTGVALEPVNGKFTAYLRSHESILLIWNQGDGSNRGHSSLP